MESIQTELRDIYNKLFPKIANLLQKYPKLNNPLLIKIPEEFYNQSSKLMVFGQQTRGWGKGSVSSLLSCYEEFNLGGNLNRTPFWNFIRKLEGNLNINPRKIIWNNLNKCAYNEGKPPRPLENKILEIFPIIPREIQIIQPNKILFLSGPNFDHHINEIFTGCSFEKIGGFAKRKLCKVNHPLLPERTFRTYHPNYLRQSKLEREYLEKISSICA